MLSRFLIAFSFLIAVNIYADEILPPNVGDVVNSDLNTTSNPFYCITDEGYTGYRNGKYDDLSNAKEYTTEESCKANCNVKQNCIFKKAKETLNPAIYRSSPTEEGSNPRIQVNSNDLIKINTELSNLMGTIVGIEIEQNGAPAFAYKGTEILNISELWGPLLTNDDAEFLGYFVEVDNNNITVTEKTFSESETLEGISTNTLIKITDKDARCILDNDNGEIGEFYFTHATKKEEVDWSTEERNMFNQAIDADILAKKINDACLYKQRESASLDEMSEQEKEEYSKKTIACTNDRTDNKTDNFKMLLLNQFNMTPNNGNPQGIPSKKITIKNITNKKITISKENKDEIKESVLEGWVDLKQACRVNVESHQITFPDLFAINEKTGERILNKTMSIPYYNGKGAQYTDAISKKTVENSINLSPDGNNPYLTLKFGRIIEGLDKNFKNIVQTAYIKFTKESILFDEGQNKSLSPEDVETTLDRDVAIRFNIKDNGEHYTCLYNENIIGDKGKNAFTKLEDCNAQCIIKSSCVELNALAKNEDGCTILSSVFSDPVIASNGETYYMSRDVTVSCPTTVSETIGCQLYETKVDNSTALDKETLVKLLNPIGVTNFLKNVSNPFSIDNGKQGLADSILKAASTDQAKIFSGESTYCDHGWFLDPPNPMDYAMAAMAIGMSVLGGGENQLFDGAVGESAKEGVGDMVTKSLENITEIFGENVDMFLNDLISMGASAAQDFIEGAFTSGAFNSALATNLQTLTQSVAYLAAGEVFFKNLAITTATILTKEVTQTIAAEYTERKERDKYTQPPKTQAKNIAFMTRGDDFALIGGELDMTTKISEEDAQYAQTYTECMLVRFNLNSNDWNLYLGGYDIGRDEFDKPIIPNTGLDKLNRPNTEQNALQLTGPEITLLREMTKNEAIGLTEDEQYRYFTERYFYHSNASKTSSYALNKVGKTYNLTVYPLLARSGHDYYMAADLACSYSIGKTEAEKNEAVVEWKVEWDDKIESGQSLSEGESLLIDFGYSGFLEQLQKSPDYPSKGLSLSDVGKALKENKGQIAKDVGTGLAISFIPFPGNVIATALNEMYKMLDNMYYKGNTCTDLGAVEERSKKEADKAQIYKRTNLALKGDLCLNIEGYYIKDQEVKSFVAATAFDVKETLRNTYCCYQDQPTKILAKIAADQAGVRLDGENCNLDITALEKISFTQCKAGQSPRKDKCVSKADADALVAAYVEGTSIGLEASFGAFFDANMKNLRDNALEAPIKK